MTDRHRPENLTGLFSGTANFLAGKSMRIASPDRCRSEKTWRISVMSAWNAHAAQFAREVEGRGATLFQSALWLETWYRTFTGPGKNGTAVIVMVEDRLSGRPVMLLPLCRYRENNLSVIGFADFGLADYNAPLINPELAPGWQQTKALMQDIYQALPPADLLKLEKMPFAINAIENPLIGLDKSHESRLCHYGIRVDGDWTRYWNGLKRNFRKDQRRRWRVLEKKGTVSFVRCNDPEEIAPLFDTLVRQQKERLDRLELDCLLDDPEMKDFYRQVIIDGCRRGEVIFTALLVNGKPVATLCGFGNGHHYAMTLSGYESGEWSKCSPGRLLTERTMQALHAEGYSYFDFTIGDEPYKKYFALPEGPLHEFLRPLSLKGLPLYTWVKLKALYRKSSLAHRLRDFLVARK